MEVIDQFLYGVFKGIICFLLGFGIGNLMKIWFKNRFLKGDTGQDKKIENIDPKSCEPSFNDLCQLIDNLKKK
ncbi:MAG: hypothetical protein ACOC22_04120 [bacterium]